MTMLGSCLCGAVRYRYDGSLGGALGAVTLCHCRQCRKAQGYAAAAAPALAAGFSVTAGEDCIREYESSPGKKRGFCVWCGAPLYSRRESSPEAIRLRLGSLDDPPDTLRIEAHIHTEGLPAWAEPNPATPWYPRQEPGRPLAPEPGSV
jgi:hypothetical protein